VKPVPVTLQVFLERKGVGLDVQENVEEKYWQLLSIFNVGVKYKGARSFYDTNKHVTIMGKRKKWLIIRDHMNLRENYWATFNVQVFLEHVDMTKVSFIILKWKENLPGWHYRSHESKDSFVIVLRNVVDFVLNETEASTLFAGKVRRLPIHVEQVGVKA